MAPWLPGFPPQPVLLPTVLAGVFFLTARIVVDDLLLSTDSVMIDN